MKRREFIAATAALLVSPWVLRAQGTPRRIGCFGIFLEKAPIILDAWRSGLRKRGWIEGKNLLVEYRYTQPTNRYPALAAELTALSPDLVVASGPQAAVALKSATATIPIVFVAVFDPVALGLVQSMSRPGGNMTGLATYAPGDFLATTAEELDIAFASAAAQHADAIIVLGDPLTNFQARELSRSRRNIICPRYISSDNSPMAD